MTGFNSNIDELIERFKVLKDKADSLDLSEALVAGVTAARGSMTFRIFNQGQDIGGVSLGSYRGKKKRASKKQFQGRNTDFLFGNPATLKLSPYEKKRLAKGRQIRYKDLEFTGTLRRGIVVIQETDRRVVCAIPSEDLLLIAKGQEEQTNAEIFGLSDEEKEVLREHVIEISKQIYDRFFNS
jgi:hypothetical protein